MKTIAMKIPPIGLQLYSVKNAWAKAPLETLGELARIGYQEVELFFHELDARGRVTGLPRETLAAELKACGLRVFASHVSESPATDWEDLIDYSLELGSAGIVVASAFFDQIADAYRLAEWLNTKAELCQKEGLTLYYHNHHHEFQELGGEVVMDVLVKETHPTAVQLELDTYWVRRAGRNPVEFMRQCGAKIGALHVKDLAKDANPINLLEGAAARQTPEVVFNAAKPTEFVEVGTGSMDISGILTEALKIPSIRHLIIEQDHCRGEELASVATSFANLKRISEALG
jgi:sugar phosphate isomerase/epimerase